MNPVPLFLIIVSLPLLLGGCGGEKKEPVAEVKSELEGVDGEELEYRKDIWYLKGSDTPYTGKVFQFYKNGQKEMEENYKDGKQEGLNVGWHSNGQKMFEGNMKNGKKDGVWTQWHESGRKSMESHYKDGVGSDVKAWRATGELIE